VKYVPLVAQARFTALQSGEVDILSRNTTFTLTRDASLGLSQTAVVYYDGQGFMVPVKSKIKSAKQLKGQTVCVQSGTTTEKNLTDYSKANALNIKPVVFRKAGSGRRRLLLRPLHCLHHRCFRPGLSPQQGLPRCLPTT
jgi:general L-amino acid transport system substrate-binding protein